MPFSSLFERAISRNSSAFPAGSNLASGRRILHVPGLPDAMPLVCYEAIFPIELGDAHLRREAADLAPERHRRRLVRFDARTLSALCAGPAARDRTRACRWCATPIPAFRRFSTVSAAKSQSPRSARRVFWTPSCPRPLAPTLQSRLGSARGPVNRLSLSCGGAGREAPDVNGDHRLQNCALARYPSVRYLISVRSVIPSAGVSAMR